MSPEQFSLELNEQDRVQIEMHKRELQAYGLKGLEGRLQRGLDPAGMLAVHETRALIDEIARKINMDMCKLDELTKALHVGAVWEKAADLMKAEKPEVKMWMLLMDAGQEVNHADISQEEYLKAVDRIKQNLQRAEQNPSAALNQAVQKTHESARAKFIKKDGVPFSEEDAFIYMAIAGETHGVCKAGDLYFVGAHELDYSLLKQEGFTAVEKQDRGRTVTFYQKEGKDTVKKLYPGLAIVFGDEVLAFRLAKHS